MFRTVAPIVLACLLSAPVSARPPQTAEVRLSLRGPAQATGKTIRLKLDVQGEANGAIDLWVAGRIVATWKLPAQRVPAEWPVEVESLPAESVSLLSLRYTPTNPGTTQEAQTTIYTPGRAKMGRLVALVVGVADYPDFKSGGVILPDLDYSRRDARRIKEFLMAQKAGGLYSAVEAVHLTDKEATLERLLREFDRIIQQNLQGNDRFVFYFSGHGMSADRKPDRTNPRVALMTHDSNPNRPLETGLNNKTLLIKLAQIGGRKLALIDCCHAGGFALNGPRIPADLRRLLPPQGDGLVVLASCRLEQESLETHQDAQSLFTRVLLQTLTAPASDTNRDGRLSLGEISEPVLGRVPVDGRAKSSRIEQHPEVYLKTLEKNRPWFTFPK